MRFEALLITAYGDFTDRRINLPRRNGPDLHVVEGPNESGKSTLLRAICDYLFGFPHLSDAAYLHDPSQLRVGAVIENNAGVRQTIFRKKGRQSTLRDANDRPLSDGALHPFVGSTDREFFQRMFGLNGDRLRSAAKDILEAKGAAAVGLFEAGAGVGGVKDVLDDLRDSASKLFKSSGQNPRLNMIRANLKNLQQRIAEQSVPGSEWAEAQRNLETATADQAEAAEKLKSLQLRQRKLERMRRNVGRIARRRELLEKIAEHVAVPRLGADAVDRRIEAERKLDFAERDRDSVAREIGEIETRREKIHVRDDVIVLADRIGALEDLIGKTLGYIEDSGTKTIQAAQQRETAVALMFDAGLPGNPENVKNLLPKAPLIARIQQLIRTHEGLQTARGEAIEDKTRLTIEVADIENEIAALPAPVDPAALEAAIEAAGSLGSPERDLAGRVRERQGMETATAEMIARLPGWQGSPGEITCLAVPAPETATKFVQMFQKADNTVAQAAEREVEAERKLTNAQGTLREAEAGGEIPSVAMLAAARSERDEKWDLIRRLYIDPKSDIDSEAGISKLVADHGPELPDDFKRAVETADAVSDRLRREADRVAKHAIALGAVSEAAANLEDRKSKTAITREKKRKVEENWSALWPNSVEVSSPTEMLEWLRLIQEILESIANACELKRQEEGLKKDIAAACSGLDHAMESLREPSSDPKETLSTKLSRARIILRRKQAEQQQMLLKQQELHGLRQQLKTAERKASEADTALEGWNAKWAAALEEIRAKLGATTAEVDALLALYGQVSTTFDEWQATARRVEGMNAEIAKFDEEVRDLVERIDPSLAGSTSVEAARKLVGFSDRNARAVEDLASLDKELKGKHKKHSECIGAVKEATDELAALCAAAGCTHPVDLPMIEKAAIERAAAELEMAKLDLDLRRDSDDVDIAVLEAEVGGVDRDALPVEIGALEESIRELQDQSTRAGEKKAEAQTNLEAMSRRAGAFASAQEYQQQRAALIPLVQDYVRLVLAADVLESVVEQYRQTHQEPLVSRAGEIFSQITGGRYSGIDVHDGVLRGLEGGKGIPYEFLSDGTRDQLYLCLRIAAIEQAIEGVEPLPFIGDDLWVNSDPDRCEGILRAMHVLAQRTQVIIFTHHPFLTELACRVDPAVNVVRL